MRWVRPRHRSPCIRFRRKRYGNRSTQAGHSKKGEETMSVTAAVSGSAQTSTMVQSGPRLDRLPISSFHKRIFWLIGAGMFFDGYDLYVGTSVLGATLASRFSTLAQNAQFVSFTFIGMTIGALAAGFLGDAYGRRFTYQFNLLLFGIASLGAAFAPSMEWLVAAGLARKMAGVHGDDRGVRPAGDDPARLHPHSAGRLARDVRDRGHRRADRLVSAQGAAGIAALAGIEVANGGGRGARGRHRKGVRRGLAAAG